MFLFFLISLILIPSAFYLYLLISRPKISGNLQITSLNAPVELIRDSYGVPHIYASNDIDGFYILGRTIASERLFQMEMMRRVAAGELAEIFGSAGIESDKLFRTLGIRRVVEKNIKLYQNDPLFLKRIEAFYRGVNDYQFNNPLPIEFKILNISPRPFSLIDAYSAIGLMSFSFAIGLNQDVLLTQLESRIGHDLVSEMRGDFNFNKRPEVMVKIKNNAFSKIPGIISYLENSFTLFDGSNGWIISKKRMNNNENLLANDPHITYTNPGIWFESYIKTPIFEDYGHFIPLIPFPILAHNQQRAFGLTMSLIDDMDVYKERIDGDNYIYKNHTIPITESTEIIKVRGNRDIKLKIRSTIHGPLLDEIIEEKGLSLRWAFFDEKNNSLFSLYKMVTAENMKQFKLGVSSGVTPGLNVLYADRENIGQWIFGKMEVKRDGINSDHILNGSSGFDEPIRELKFEEKPFLENPSSGVIISANNQPKNLPRGVKGDFQPMDRYKTIESVLNQKEKWSEDEIKELQTLSMNFANKRMKEILLSELKRTEESKEYLETLSNWNLSSESESIAPSIYYVLINKIAKNVLANELTMNEINTFGKLPNAYNFTYNLILNENSAWWKKYSRKKIFNLSFKETITFLKNKLGKSHEDWQWGKLHQLTFGHPLGKIKPLNMIFNLGPFGLNGANQEINNQKYSWFREDYNIHAGPSTRRIISFAHIDETYGVLPSGQSGHILSPFYRDQIDLFLNNKYRPMLMNREKILKGTHYILRFNP